MAWMFLLLASACQTGWTYSLKYADFGALAQFRFTLPVLVPIIINIISGLANVFFLSLAFKQIPLTTAFGAWTAGTLVLLKLADVVFLKAAWSVAEVFFIGLLAVGVVGLKLVAPK
ncbi:DMT family transporter [Fibrella aquatilis]|uniref:Guanidinium exporter n=1 Tax=Fibrella aquatilis TaxID=2817059 RepID=A0A939G9H3_9BACT|nr:SMR family transporter [Fibrella aquatilis]MBO0934276.1 hypothetical protein [Fibrella aquatilis]